MPSVHDVAHYFLSLSDPAEGDAITHLKLQKLVYYAQGFHLALYDKPLFDEAIEAWRHGPVVPALYREFRDFGDSVIPRVTEFDADTVLTREQQGLLDEVNEVYGQFSGWKLRDMTHQEAPWKDADARGTNATITHEALKDFFVTRINK